MNTVKLRGAQTIVDMETVLNINSGNVYYRCSELDFEAYYDTTKQIFTIVDASNSYFVKGYFNVMGDVTEVYETLWRLTIEQDLDLLSMENTETPLTIDVSDVDLSEITIKSAVVVASKSIPMLEDKLEYLYSM